MELRKVKEHIEVYNNNKFLFSADNRQEAERELKSQMHIKMQPFKSFLSKVYY
jgi:hypothetical protein